MTKRKGRRKRWKPAKWTNTVRVSDRNGQWEMRCGWCKLLGEGGSVLQVALVGGRRGEIQRCPDMLQGSLKSSPALGRSPGEGNGYPLQSSCLENPSGQRSLAGYSSRGRKCQKWLSTHADQARRLFSMERLDKWIRCLQKKKSAFRYTEKFTTIWSSKLQIRIQANTSWLHSPTHGTGWSCVAGAWGKQTPWEGRHLQPQWPRVLRRRGDSTRGGARGRETLFSSPLTSDRKLAYLPVRQLG